MRPVDSFSSIQEAFFAATDAMPEHLVYTQVGVSSATGGPRSATYREVASRVVAAAHYLQRLGAVTGDRIAILSSTRPEWMEADLAILSAGAVSVSVYQSLPSNDVAYILFDSGAQIVFAENQEQVQKLLSAAGADLQMARTEDREAQVVRIGIKKIISFEPCDPHPLVEQWSAIVEKAPQSFSAAAGSPDALAALVYTSGTTGPPKGVMQSHRNHLSNVRQAFDCGMVVESSTIMLFLPLAHSFAKLMGYIGFLSPVSLLFPSISDHRSSRADAQTILRDIQGAGAKIVPVVPRFLEKMKEGLEAAARRKDVRGRLLSLTLRSAARQARGERGVLQLIAFEGTSGLRRKIRARLFGPHFEFAVSGGAKLPVDVALFFDGLGIEILEGYGLTETCVATNVNPRGRKKIGTVGPVLAPDIEVRLEEDGEVSFRGPNVSLGYFQRPTATRASWSSDGWFRTGDLGSIDADGYLSIVGRKKEIIVTSGGKKISPQAIEERLCAIPLVSQAVLIGDGRPFCIALLTLDKQAVTDWETANPSKSREQLADNIRDAIDRVNADLSSFETVKNFIVLEEELSVDNGLLTPTFKAKRKTIEERYRERIEETYRQTKKGAL